MFKEREEKPVTKYWIGTPQGFRPATEEEQRKSLAEKVLGYKPPDENGTSASVGRSGRGY